MTIAVEERGTNNIFVPACFAACYDWNSAPINGIDILHNVPAISRELHFSLEINFNATPKLIPSNTYATLEYL